MSRKAQDPVDRAFDNWRELNEEQKRRLADLQRGWNLAMGAGDTVTPTRTRKPKRKAAAETSE